MKNIIDEFNGTYKISKEHNENGRQRHVEVEDEWLTANGIEEGSSWKENITDEA